MHVHCFGTTGYHPSPTRHTACYYIPEADLLLDAGTGMFRLTRALLESPRRELDIFLSHVHLDHIVGLTFLLDTMALTDLDLVRVHGEQKKLDAVRDHLFHELIFPVQPNCEWYGLDNDSGRLELSGCTLDYFPLEHPGGTLGCVIESNQQRIAYITDTVARDEASYLEHIKRCDLLLHECYFRDVHHEFAEKTGHSWLSAVESVVRLTRPQRTALIHINPLAEVIGEGLDLSEAQAALGIFVAQDEDILQVPKPTH